MYGIESLAGTTYAGALVGIVLLEALVLYVGYGGLTRLVRPVIDDVIQGE